MILPMLVRRLRPGVSFAEFREAWLAAPNHFGTAGAEVLARPEVAREEQARHPRIDDVIEAIVARGLYEVVDTTELS